MERIKGIGGIFFKSNAPAVTSDWYVKNLGLPAADDGSVLLRWRRHDDTEKAELTVWAPFPSDTKYMEPSQASFMVNYIVDDMDAMIAQLEKAGVKIDEKREEYEYGKFAWIYDPDGNKIELWQPTGPGF